MEPLLTLDAGAIPAQVKWISNPHTVNDSEQSGDNHASLAVVVVH